jgi:hypothetical protein
MLVPSRLRRTDQVGVCVSGIALAQLGTSSEDVFSVWGLLRYFAGLAQWRTIRAWPCLF